MLWLMLLLHLLSGQKKKFEKFMISDIEKILDEVIFIDNGKIILQENADELRSKENCSIDEIFRRKFYVK